MPIVPEVDVKTKLPDVLEPVPLPPTASTTDRPIREDARLAFKYMLIRSQMQRLGEHAAGDDDLADDLLIALEVRMRSVRDDGSRVELAEFMQMHGYEPGDFGT
jgi:hypothetical protein